MVLAPKAHEVLLKLSQAIFGGLGRATTHNQAPDVGSLLHQSPLGFCQRPIRGERSLVVNLGHARKDAPLRIGIREQPESSPIKEK
jgi:hypothetical protein